MELTADLAGLVTSRSVFLGAEGCRVGREGAAMAPVDDDPPATAKHAAKPLPVDPVSPALEAALDREFAEPDSSPHRWTKSVVILRDGHIVAERYAPGYGPETPQIGWSVTKSVTNALIGILVRQRKLAVEAPAPVAAWRDPKDPRHTITIDNLLRMNSGIEFGQSLYADWRSAFDASTHPTLTLPACGGREGWGWPTRRPLPRRPSLVLRRGRAGATPMATPCCSRA
jgi:CubicO group peptidase (beta-lactamase class C family)